MSPPVLVVSVIIVSHNGIHLLGECLDALRAQSFRDFEVIVVDNGSTDGSVDFIREAYPEVKVIAMDKNTGFGGGNNAGIKEARGKYIALLNNDAVAHKDWLKALIEAAENSPEGYGMWASKTLLYDRRDIIDTAGHLIYPDGLNVGRGKGETATGRYQLEEEVFFPSSAAALYLKKMLDDIGLFDEDFFAYGDDTELGLRARLAGWKCLFVPTAVAYHKSSMTAGRYSAFKFYHVERNRIWVLLKCFPVKYILMSPFYTSVRLLHHLISTLRGRGAAPKFEGSYLKLLGIYAKAVFDGLRGGIKMLRKRKRVKRNVSSREFSAWLGRFGISAREIALKE